jgi:putative hemolysin
MTVKYLAKLAQTPQELAAARSLRYEVFVKELGAGGALVDHTACEEQDEFDPFCDHLILLTQPQGQVVGVYRLMRECQADKAGRFYSEGEYDLTKLRHSGRTLLELGRSCVHPDHRGGPALFHLWNALAAYVEQHQIELLFGVASFHGTDQARLAMPLSLLHQRYLAPDELRVRARDYTPMNVVAPADLNAAQAMQAMPALIKSYLRLGGVVGDGAFIDRPFNTTDVCLILDTEKMNARQARFYQGTRP